MFELTSRDLRHNLKLNCAHEFSWGFGIAFHTTYATIPFFLKQLGAPQGVVVSVAGLFSILIAIPQLFSAIAGRNIRNVKTAVIAVHTLSWPPVFVMAFTFAIIAPTGPYAWVFYYICFILYGLAVGLIIPIWAGFLSHVSDRKSRGSFLGVSFAFNSLGGFVGGFLVKYILSSSIPFPKNFGLGFFIMFFAIVIGTLVFFGYRVNRQTEVREKKSVSEFLRETREIIKTDLNFRRYLLARIFFTANFPAVSMYAIYTKDKFGFDISEAGVFTVLNVMAFGLASYLSGKIGDRFGHKAAIILAFAAHLLALITALNVRSMIGVYGIFIFLGFGLGAFMPASMNLVYDFAGKRDNKTYMALVDTVLAPFTFLVITFAGSISHTIQTETLFKGVGVFLVIGLLILTFVVKDPKPQTHELPVPPTL
ncbi:MAG: MFS transporter [FCB group bacterium]|nr:MFS transporter [FCB group bacterium]